MFKRSTKINHTAVTVLTRLLKREVYQFADVLGNDVDDVKVNVAGNGRDDVAANICHLFGIFVKSEWSNKLWRELIFLNQL